MSLQIEEISVTSVFHDIAPVCEDSKEAAGGGNAMQLAFLHWRGELSNIGA
jgi:hypothetical protein